MNCLDVFDGRAMFERMNPISTSLQHHESVSELDAQKPTIRSPGRKASITQEELFDATLNLLRSGRSIASLSLREIAREAGIAPNSFYRHFRDIDELAIALIGRSGLVLRQIIRQARLEAQKGKSVVQSSVDIFVHELDTDEGNLRLLLREGYTGSVSYRQAVEQQLRDFEQELQEDIVRLEKHHDNTLNYPDLVAKAITQLVFNMGAKVVELPPEERQAIADQTVIMIRILLIGARKV